MNPLEQFIGVMEFQPVDRVPNWEEAAWEHTKARWAKEGLDGRQLHWNWGSGEAALNMDPREHIPYNAGPIPPYEEQVVAEDERTITVRNPKGVVRRSLKEGSIGRARLSMDEFVDWPVHTRQDWREHKKRYDPALPCRYEPNWHVFRVAGWRNRSHPLVFGRHPLETAGFYMMAREWMGTEAVSYAWYDCPAMMHEMMQFWADFLIEAARPVLEKTDVDYIIMGEDLSMKTGPLISPALYKTFIYPHASRVVEFYKSHGVRYVVIDSDGNPEAIIPMWLEMGVDAIWPCERAANMDPLRLRKTFGKSLRLWGGVDKRELAKGLAAIDAHLRELAPLIEEGGYIPTVDHSVPPNISWPNFQHYMETKMKLLRGEL